MPIRLHHLLRRFAVGSLLVGIVCGESLRAAEPVAAEGIWTVPTPEMSWRAADDVDQVFAEEPSSSLIESTVQIPPITTAVEESTEKNPDTFEPGAAESDLQRVLGRMAWLTIGLGVVGVAGLWALKIWVVRRGGVSRGADSLQLINTLRLGPRSGVHLLQVESHRVLVGFDQGKTMTLQVLPAAFSDSLKEAIVEEEAETETVSAPARDPFDRVADVFSALQGRSLWTARRSA
jgi:flagellar biogenesis protein FliO